MKRFHVAASARTTLWVVLAAALTGQALANPTVEQALRLAPVQKEVDYARPSAEEAARCRIESRKLEGGASAWIVSDANGLVLRMFVDTNGNNTVDQWRYYKDGVEVYRDIDSTFNQKADQFRWFHTAGTRWGIDQNRDGEIDSWKQISPEEVTAEVVSALAQADTARFQRLVLTGAELRSLGLSPDHAEQLAEKLGGIERRFQEVASAQQAVTKETKWLQFSGTQPGIVPAGSEGSTKDLEVYENVVAVVETAGQTSQVYIGTLVRVGPVWRVIDVPQTPTDDPSAVAARGFFFQPAGLQREIRSSGPSEAMQELLGQLEKLDRQAADAATEQAQAEYTLQRAELIENIAQSAQDPQDQVMWLRQLADMISAAVQMGHCPDGAQRLEDLYDRFAEEGADQDILAYLRFRQYTAEYGLALQKPRTNFQSVQEEWLENLEQFVDDYPEATDAAEAMLQLGMAHEFAGEEEEAKEWFGRVVRDFPNSPGAAKAAGARRRLDSVGKQLEFRGRSPAGDVVDLAKYRGKVMLIQYWATWSEAAKVDMSMIKDLVARYSPHFGVIGVSLDHSVKDLAEYVKEQGLKWPQIHEDGGLDSRPANQLGILTVPTMILVDQQGRVVHRNIQASELDREVRRLLTTKAAGQPGAPR